MLHHAMMVSLSFLLLAPQVVQSQTTTWAMVRKDTLRVELTETGEIGAVNSTVVSAPQIWSLDLQITSLAAEGMQVDSGAVLVEFDRTSLHNQFNTKKTELDAHLASLRSMQAEHEAQIQELVRNVEIADYALKLAQVQLEQLKFESEVRRESGELEVLKAGVALKEANTRLEAQKIINNSAQKKLQLVIFQSQGEVNRMQRQLDQLTLRAPLPGMVVYHADWDGKKPELGGKIRPGRGVIDLPDLSRMQVKIPVNEVDAAKLKLGQEALLTLEAFPKKTFRARLIYTTQIASSKDWESTVRIFGARLEIMERDSLLKPGMTAKVRVQLGVIPDATLLPLGAVYELEGKPVVFTKKSPRKPTPIEITGRNDFYVSIAGLEVGAEVSWQAGDPRARPLGYAAYQARLAPPASEREDFFKEMEKRQLTFDYEAHRNRPPEPPGGAPGGMEAMMKQLNLPGGEMAKTDIKITLTPEMMKQMPKGGVQMQVKKDSANAKSNLKTANADSSQVKRR
ncbi:efflux RND transporter periplasmic adaptor subunit [candidate division KSB1 bacterium]|nr:efflux RND transporter periplasmic adaptor subunit [candidate division KSB1 bacterium]